jgi:acetyl esterase/lipase
MADAPRIPSSIEAAIRARGPVLDLSLVHSLYEQSLEGQPRDGVAVTRDLSYGPDERHRVDVYQPADATDPSFPGLLFLHGGGFIRGDKAGRDNVGLYFARQGFVTLVSNYRLAPAHSWPSGAEDVTRALVWAQGNIGRWKGDPQRVFVAGESAGAAHVALATLVRRFHSHTGSHIAGALLISGVYNVQLERLARRQFGISTPDPRNDAYFGSNWDALPAMSTVDLIDASPVPLFMSYAELDMIQMQVQAGELFSRLVTRHGFDPELCVIRGHNHLSQVYSINTGDESLSGPMIGFLRRHL